MKRLWNWNLINGCLHGVQFLAQFYLSFFNERISENLLFITTIFTNWDAGYPKQQQEVYYKIVFLRWTSYFALLSALAHFTVLLFWKRYTTDLARGLNHFRWIEYSLSASLIMTLLFAIWGNFDLFQLLGCFVMNALMCLFGDLHEVLN